MVYQNKHMQYDYIYQINEVKMYEFNGYIDDNKTSTWEDVDNPRNRLQYNLDAYFDKLYIYGINMHNSDENRKKVVESNNKRPTMKFEIAKTSNTFCNICWKRDQLLFDR